MRSRAPTILVCVVLALVASGLFVPVRDGVRLTAVPPEPETGPAALAPESDVRLEDRHEAFLARGGILFVDRPDDIRLGAAWRRSFRRVVVRIDGVPVRAWRGDFIYKRLMFGTQALIVLVGLGLWLRATRPASGPHPPPAAILSTA